MPALGMLDSIGLGGGDPVLVPRLPLGFSLTPAAIQGPPPALGEHTRAVLKESRFSDAEIEELLRSKICEAAQA